MEALFESVSGRVFGSIFTNKGHIWRPILRKVWERKMLRMVWKEKKVNCTVARKGSYGGLSMEALFESVTGKVFEAKFTKGCHVWRPILRKVCEQNLQLMVWEHKE